MTKAKRETSTIKTMIAQAAAVKILPVVKRMDNLEEMLAGIQATLKAIQARLNIAPDNPAFEAVNSGLDADPISQIQKSPLARGMNPLVFPENRRAVERIWAKRGWKEGDTVQSVLKEATGG